MNGAEGCFTELDVELKNQGFACFPSLQSTHFTTQDTTRLDLRFAVVFQQEALKAALPQST